MKKYLLLFFVLSLLVIPGCVNTPEHFQRVGFDSSTEAKAFADQYLYFAYHLSDEEWEAFYKEFPEYWQDLHFGPYAIDYHPWYTAYAFQWTTLKRKQAWGDAIVQRLDRGRVQPGDSLFKVAYALGGPSRIVWENESEIFLYANDKAYIFQQGTLQAVKPCKACWVLDQDQYPLTDQQIKERVTNAGKPSEKG